MNSAEAEQIFKEELYQLPARVIVLIPVSWENLSEDQIVQLRKILEYVKLNLDGVQILHHETVEIERIVVYNPSLILSFGTKLIPDDTSDGLQTINALSIIRTGILGSLDDVQKRNLMNALKQAFGQ